MQVIFMRPLFQHKTRVLTRAPTNLTTDAHGGCKRYRHILFLASDRIRLLIHKDLLLMRSGGKPFVSMSPSAYVSPEMSGRTGSINKREDAE